MNLSKSQQSLFWRKWADACRASGYTKQNNWSAAQIDNERHSILSRCGFESLRDVDPTAGFDRVLAELEALIDPSNLAAQLRLANQPSIRAQFAIDQLKTEIAKVSPGNNYLRAVMLDKFGTTDWDTLTLEQFIQLYATLRNRKKSRQLKSVAPEMTPQEVTNEISADPF